jgi:hypothetical protein
VFVFSQIEIVVIPKEKIIDYLLIDYY